MTVRPRLGRFLGISAAAAAVGLLSGWVLLALSKRGVLIPFYGSLRSPSSPGIALVVLCCCALLAVTGWALMGQRRIAVPLFLLGGWLGLVNSAAMLWPYERLRKLAQFALQTAKHRGVVGEDATLTDLVKSQLPPGSFSMLVGACGAVLVIWLVLLIAGSVHLVRQRGQYRA
jgi:hypothetical protein